MKKLITTLMLGMMASAVCAQTKRIGDYIESMSYNSTTPGAPRCQQYRPEGRGFVTVNGTNRFTRALYGSPTDWRLETSDRPVFAVAKKNHHRNIRMVVRGVALDATTYCKSIYEGGIRSYELRDKQWGDATLNIKVVALPDEEGAVWHFRGNGFTQDMNVQVKVCEIAQPKLQRNGDIGADKPGVFEPDVEESGLVVSGATYTDATRHEAYVVMKLNEVVELSAHEASQLFEKAARHFEMMSRRILFNTPDPYINTLGGALVLAADGDWDGTTWLHGCVGWRMPLAGWRAGYLGDVLGWSDRALSHFNAYANSQVTDVTPDLPHPTQDPKQQMARSEKKWHTQMYSNGYICRNPNRNDQMHHYDMNLNYVDELLWHFQYDADPAYMRKMWPVLQRHLAWEKRNFDPDGDHLYDAYCCIWASDALYYSGGAVTHSSAYNYRGNKLAARIAHLIGEDASPYEQEAEAILKAMNQRLWLEKKGHWAEFQDLMGEKRVHESAAVWSIYTPIDCGACTPEQAYRATQYIDREIPHIPLNYQLSTIATSNWLPYSWSINNVAAAEVMHTALAYFEAGRKEEGFRLMKANVIDQMYYGRSPANFGQVSHYDAARGECYRDFGDCIGISSRTLLQGLFGIIPQALYGQCILRPGFPQDWDSCSIHTPYLDYQFTRKDGTLRFVIDQRFKTPLQMVLRLNLGEGRYRDIVGTKEAHQVIEVKEMYKPQLIDRYFNACVDDIFKQEYRTPRPPYTTLQIPLQGIGEWCHPHYKPDINDSVFRTMIQNGTFTVAGIPFRTPQKGRNIVYTSLWDNYPDSITIPLHGQASKAWLLMAGSTNHMQCHIDNGLVVAQYRDGSMDTLRLVNPDTWCPIEQDFYVDGMAFKVSEPRPYRVSFGTGVVSRDLGGALGIKGVYGREIPGGAGLLLCLPLDNRKHLKALTVRTLSNDIVVGLMGITLE